MRDDKDRGSKWYLQHHGDCVLGLAGIADFRLWRAARAELVQPKTTPDGLLEEIFDDDAEPLLFVIVAPIGGLRSPLDAAFGFLVIELTAPCFLRLPDAGSWDTT